MPTTDRSVPACSTHRPGTAISMAARLTLEAISAAMAAATAPERRPATKQKAARYGGLFYSAFCEARLDHHHLGADLDLFVEVDDVLVAHADAAGRHRLSYRPRLVRTVDAIERGTKVHRARTQRILRAAGHEEGEGGGGGGDCAARARAR